MGFNQKKKRKKIKSKTNIYDKSLNNINSNSSRLIEIDKNINKVETNKFLNGEGTVEKPKKKNKKKSKYKKKKKNNIFKIKNLINSYFINNNIENKTLSNYNHKIE